MDKKDFEKLIDKHMKINERQLRLEQLKGMMGMEHDEEMVQAHAGACTALKMLKMELNGEKSW